MVWSCSSTGTSTRCRRNVRKNFYASGHFPVVAVIIGIDSALDPYNYRTWNFFLGYLDLSECSTSTVEDRPGSTLNDILECSNVQGTDSLL
ncbi:hypothetical protein L218DRAFT_715730 [Marasmius fiardii PR-910]|nr:hypothetical protein L218DRAFT_715730 [Marasmius fiardii PR-910]